MQNFVDALRALKDQSARMYEIACLALGGLFAIDRAATGDVTGAAVCVGLALVFAGLAGDRE